jgi:WD40 repeat protein
MCVVEAGGGQVWTGGSKGLVSVWNAAEHRCLQIFPAHSDKKIYAMLSLGNRVWSAAEDGTICVWDAQVPFDTRTDLSFSYSDDWCACVFVCQSCSPASLSRSGVSTKRWCARCWR